MLGELLRKRTVSLHLTFKALRLYRLVLLVLCLADNASYQTCSSAEKTLCENQIKSICDYHEK